jgi:hypothetical protein
MEWLHPSRFRHKPGGIGCSSAYTLLGLTENKVAEGTILASQKMEEENENFFFTDNVKLY